MDYPMCSELVTAFPYEGNRRRNYLAVCQTPHSVCPRLPLTEPPKEPDDVGQWADIDDALSTELPGRGEKLAARIDAVKAYIEYLRDREMRRADFIPDVHPDHPAEFDSEGG